MLRSTLLGFDFPPKNPPSQVNILGFDSSSDGGTRGTVGGMNNKLNEFDSSGNEEHYNRSNTENVNVLSDQNLSTKSQETGANSLSIFGSKVNQKAKLDWREYFEDAELDKAYQIVEVE